MLDVNEGRDMSSTEFLAEVARLYYHEELSQMEVARRIGVSRSTVSRMLREARQRGIVQIQIQTPTVTATHLERRLERAFGLEVARVYSAPGSSYGERLSGAGALAARQLREELPPEPVVALGWGMAVYEVVAAFPPTQAPGGLVLEIIGSLGMGDPKLYGPELARRLAEKLGTPYRYLSSPLIVSDRSIREALLGDPNVQATLERARDAHLAVIGIGSVNPEISTLLRHGYLTRQDLEALDAAGVVGDICGHHLLADGRLAEDPINERVVAISPEALRQIPVRLGVAVGRRKAPAILGALRGGYLTALFTDEGAAAAMLARVVPEGAARA